MASGHPYLIALNRMNKIPIDFGGPFNKENGIEQYFLTSIDRYSKYPTVEIVNNVSSAILNTYKYNHRVPKTIRLDQVSCLTGKKFETFLSKMILNQYKHLQTIIEQ